MTTRPSVYRSLPWLIVAGFLVGGIVVAAGIAAGSPAVIIVGAVVAAVAAVCGVVLPRRGVSPPISFADEWPPTTVGPRGRHGPQPPFDTEPNAPPRPPPPPIQEIHSVDAPQGPDRERSFAQHYNLDPHERLHQIGGTPYIELADEEEAEVAAEEPAGRHRRVPGSGPGSGDGDVAAP